LGGRLQDLKDHRFSLLTVAIASLSLFGLQQRQSATARSILNHIGHGVWMTGTCAVAIGSILGIVVPHMLLPEETNDETSTKTTRSNATCLVRTTTAQSILSNFTKRISWKGTIAALVLFYFRRRYLIRHGQSNMPRRFS
jgi:hypothetical protein